MKKSKIEDARRLQMNLGKILHFSGESANVDFLMSSLVDEGHSGNVEDIVEWLDNMNRSGYFDVERVPLTGMRKWYVDPETGDICHESGKFFSIRGLVVSTNTGPVHEWGQPIIDQPEIGVLGIITKKIDGILHFLLQAKAEPGNINTFQLSPTVQATRSNFTGVHGGKKIPYLDYFLEDGKSEVLIDQLQSEQGSRFYKKRNRNIIVRVHDDEEIELSGVFKWVTLGQIKSLLRKDDMVNMDTRSVISSISYIPDRLNSMDPVNISDLYDCFSESAIVSNRINELDAKLIVSAHYNTPALHTTDYLLHKVTENKFSCSLDARLVGLNSVAGWEVSENEIYHKEHKFFSVVGVRIEATGREVLSWDQPIVRQVDPGLVGFIAADIAGVVHFLVQLKTESGSMDLMEFAPTVQCITGSYEAEAKPPYVDDLLQGVGGEVVRDSCQSEEGGRFYQESNRNMVLLKGQSADYSENERYIWMTMKQLKNFVRYNNFVNVEARSLLSIM